MLLPQERLDRIDYYEITPNAPTTDGSYTDFVTIHWKPVPAKQSRWSRFWYGPLSHRPDPTVIKFRRSQSPHPEHEGYVTTRENPDFVELKKQLRAWAIGKQEVELSGIEIGPDGIEFGGGDDDDDDEG